jgi:hypothetical protein
MQQGQAGQVEVWTFIRTNTGSTTNGGRGNSKGKLDFKGLVYNIRLKCLIKKNIFTS